MSPETNERWERVSSLFGAARLLPAVARESFLSLACEGDDTLRAEVEVLLASDTPDDLFPEDPPWTRIGQSVVHALTSSMGLTSGHVLSDRYRIERQLATGGQALVYLAHDLHLMMRPVVIKVMRAEGRWNRWLKSRFEREMQALSRIDHPGVVGMLDVGALEDGSPFLVIQHVPGMSLRELLSQGPVLPARAAGILRQIGSALRAAHAAGIAHRDLKPENVMLLQGDDRSEVVRLIDFGIAKIDRSALGPDTTAVLVAGTVRYMAPEQFEGRHSTASDVYAMALVACEMLGGYPHIGALPERMSGATRAALESALAFRAEDRPSDVQAWSESLARTLVGDAAEPVRIVEKVGAFDPLSEGFEAREDVTWSGVAESFTHAETAYDAWRIVADTRGLYHHPFTEPQKRRAMERGWKLTVEMRVEEGVAHAAAEFTPVGPGFPIQVQDEGDREIVRLPTRVVPDMRGLEFVQRPPGEYHRYELMYDPELKTADLWIDGQRRLTGFRGYAENIYRLEAGLLFGTAAYKSERGAGSFRWVRLEIHP